MIDIPTIEIILSIISLIGMALVARHETRLPGFTVCAIGNIGWIIQGILILHLPYIILFSGYLVFNSIGIHDEYSTYIKVKRAKSLFNHDVK